MNKLILSAILFAAIVATAYGFACPANFCDSVKCDNLLTQELCEKTNGGVYRERGTFCGCCPSCLTKLSKFLTY